MAALPFLVRTRKVIAVDVAWRIGRYDSVKTGTSMPARLVSLTTPTTLSQGFLLFVPPPKRKRLQNGLCEHLAYHSPPPGPERGPERDLPLPVRGACAEHAGHVGRGNQEDESNRGCEHEQRRPGAGSKFVLQPDELHAQAPVACMLAFEPPRDRVHFLLRLAERNARLQARHTHQPEEAPARAHLGTRRERFPQVGFPRRIAERGRHHAGDRVGLAVERDRAADDGWIGAEPPHPEAVAQNRDARAAELIVAPREGAAERGTGAHYTEEVRRHRRAADVFGVAGPGEHVRRATVGGEAFDGAALGTPVLEARIRRHVVIEALLRVGHPHHHDPVGIVVWQLPQQDGLDDAEDRGVGADAKREGRQRGGSEPWSVGERAQPVFQVVPHEPAVFLRRLDEHARHGVEPYENRVEPASAVPEAVGEGSPQLAPVFVAEARRVQVQRRREDGRCNAFHVMRPSSPVARASASSCSRRRASISATRRPRLVNL